MFLGFPGNSVVKNPFANAGDIRDAGSIPGSGRKWQSTPVFLPGESREQRSLVGYSPSGLKEWDMTEGLTLPLHIIFYNLRKRDFKNIQ